VQLGEGHNVSFCLPPRLLLSKLLVLGTLLGCFAIVLGAGNLLNAIPRERVQLDSVPAFALASAAQTPWIDRNSADPTQFAAELVAVLRQMEVPVAPFANSDPGSESMRQGTIVGIWAPDASSCSLQNFRDGLLPTVINFEGASAGDTFCGFKNQKQTETGWRMDALCSNKQQQWATNVHLTVKGERLVWKSKRGSQTYTRCMNDSRMAEAH
jgi:hypothetical protein